jgi:glycolate oxidase iron-sulfur subunit
MATVPAPEPRSAPDTATGSPASGSPATGAFDAHHPPDPDLLADCVHCGFCLPACPTYNLWGEEMDSPRGRVYLMGLAERGEVAIDDAFVTHMDRCLGCMACVTACPSGVQYDKLIEATRPQIERHHTRGRRERAWRALLFALFPHPGRLRVVAVLAWCYEHSRLRRLLRRRGVLAALPERVRALESLLPPAQLGALLTRLPEGHLPTGPVRRRVGLVTGCVQRVWFSDVNAATARVLAAEGCEVAAPRGQPCCGALLEHTGLEERALDHARRLIAVMEEARVDTVVSNAAGCGSTMKQYGHLLRDDPAWAERARDFSSRVRDVTELLDELGPVAPRQPIPARVAYHDACHLGHAQGVRAQPRAILRSIPGVEPVELAEGDLCCGSAGIYNLLQPEAADDLGRRKAAIVRAAEPDALVTANPGCLLQLRRHLGDRMPLLHPIELLDAAIRGVDPVAARRRPAP